tara:strand:+ start:25568 stop:26029 length:462 start_codon:yes stop_codon:yes gene_type:complete
VAESRTNIYRHFYKHGLHRGTKTPLSTFFSRQQMLKLDSEVHDFAQMTVNKVLASAGEGAFDVNDAFIASPRTSALIMCVMTQMDFVAQQGWGPNLATWVKSFFQRAYMVRHYALGRKMAQILSFIANFLREDIKAGICVMNVAVLHLHRNYS